MAISDSYGEGMYQPSLTDIHKLREEIAELRELLYAAKLLPRPPKPKRVKAPSLDDVLKAHYMPWAEDVPDEP